MSDEFTFLKKSDLEYDAPIEVSTVAIILGLDEEFVWSEVHRGKLLVTADCVTSAQFARSWWCELQIELTALRERFYKALDIRG